MNSRPLAAFAVCLLTVAVSMYACATVAHASDESLTATGVGTSSQGDKVYSTRSTQTQITEIVKERFTRRFPNLSVTAVRRTPYGLFEIQVGGDFLYADEKVTWVMQGKLIDAITQREVSRDDTENTVSFDQLPLAWAVKHVSGNGARKIAIFEDPNCGYCKQLRKTLAAVDNLTIYTFIYPVLSADSKEKARDVWCAKNPSVAWDEWMLKGKAPVSADCSETPADQILALGQRLMVRGIPTTFFTSGVRVSGALSLDQLNAYLQNTP